MLEIIRRAQWFIGDKYIEGEGFAVGDLAKIEVGIVYLVVKEAGLHWAGDHDSRLS